MSAPPPAGDEGNGAEPVQLTLAPELQSVGRARAKLVQLAKQWGCPDELVQDARIVLSELMSNGILHARTELQVVVSPLRGGGLRVEVHDASSMPVMPPMEFPEAATSLLDQPLSAEMMREHWAAPSATGRGLAMVSALANTWGWFPDAAGGKVVWVELGAGRSATSGRERAYAERSMHAVRPIRLIALPLRLLKGSEDHFDDLFRELQMAGLAAMPERADQTSPAAIGSGGEEGDLRLVSDELAPLAENIKSRLARLREPVRRAIWEAARRGDRLIDLDLLGDSGLPAVIQAVDELLAKAAKAARLGLLLTEPPGAEVVAWRRWLRHEVEDQIGGRAPRACPFPVAPLHEEDTGPAWDKLDAARREAVAEVHSLLSGGAGPGASSVLVPAGSWADTSTVAALRRVLAYVKAKRCVLCLLAEDNETVAFGASVGFSPAVARFWDNYSLSADLPASEVIRTGKPLFFRTFAELDERYPIFLSTPSESDPALACLPLVTDGHGPSLGCLTIGFGQARDFSPGEVEFLRQLTGAICNFIVEQRRDEAVRMAGERMRALDEAGAAVGRATTKHGVLTELVQAVAAFITDGASVHTVEENGTVTFVANRYRDPGREAAAARLLQKRQLRGEATQMVTECIRTGQPSVLQMLSEEAMALAAADDEELELLRQVGAGSVGALPVWSRGELVAVVTVANNAGRFISDDDLGSVKRLAGEAGEALAHLGRSGGR